MLLYIVRHGDPIYVTDTLTERGKLQAEAVGKRLAMAKIDRIFTSPMGRARETAEPLCRLLGKEYTVEEWTHEIEDERLTPFPDGKLKSVSVVQNTYFRQNGNIHLDYDHAGECDGFSTSGMVEKTKFIEEKVALFCHGAFGRAWISTLLHIPLHMMWASFEYTHTGVTVLRFENNANGVTAPRCLCYSDISHLYMAGMDTFYNNVTEI